MTDQPASPHTLDGLADAIRELMSYFIALRTFAVYGQASVFAAMVQSGALKPKDALAVRLAAEDAFRGACNMHPVDDDPVGAKALPLLAEMFRELAELEAENWRPREAPAANAAPAPVSNVVQLRPSRARRSARNPDT